MKWIDESTTDGVRRRTFELEVAGERVPGFLWTPAGADGPRPLVLIGHGGTQSKATPSVVEKAHRYAGAYGFAVAAIDAPTHGDRVTPEEAAAFAEVVRQRIASGGFTPEVYAEMRKRELRAVDEWKATLDALQALDEIGVGPVGYWGVSMGTAIGVPFVSGEPRITAAVLGLAGLLRGGPEMAALAAGITIPVEFVLQLDDEVAPRDSALALFDALGSTEKTLHANPGRHLEVPQFERASWERFFVRHLTPPADSAT